MVVGRKRPLWHPNLAAVGRSGCGDSSGILASPPMQDSTALAHDHGQRRSSLQSGDGDMDTDQYPASVRRGA